MTEKFETWWEDSSNHDCIADANRYELAEMSWQAALVQSDAEIERWKNIAANLADLRDEYKQQLCEADAAHKEEIAKINKSHADVHKAYGELEQQLSAMTKKVEERDALISRQADRLQGFEFCDDGECLYCGATPDKPEHYDGCLIHAAISASAESVAEWEAEKLDPLRRQVAMLHSNLINLRDQIHEFATHFGEADFFTGDATKAIIDTQATAEAYDREHAAKVRKEYRKELLPKMVERFLSWKLPKNFNPDAGISFTPKYNVGTPYEKDHEPIGTNLFDADQAKSMVAVMLGGISDEQVDNMVDILRTELRAQSAQKGK